MMIEFYNTLVFIIRFIKPTIESNNEMIGFSEFLDFDEDFLYPSQFRFIIAYKSVYRIKCGISEGKLMVNGKELHITCLFNYIFTYKYEFVYLLRIFGCIDEEYLMLHVNDEISFKPNNYEKFKLRINFDPFTIPFYKKYKKLMDILEDSNKIAVMDDLYDIVFVLQRVKQTNYFRLKNQGKLNIKYFKNCTNNTVFVLLTKSCIFQQFSVYVEGLNR